MKTLRELVENLKCRKGTAAGTTKNGAFWLACEPIKIRRFGGDGIGNSGPDITYYLLIRHFRDGAVRCTINRAAYHQNGSYSGGGDSYFGIDNISNCNTIEEIIVALKAYRSDYDEMIYSDYCEKHLVSALTALGITMSAAAPDEQ